MVSAFLVWGHIENFMASLSLGLGSRYPPFSPSLSDLLLMIHFNFGQDGLG